MGLEFILMTNQDVRDKVWSKLLPAATEYEGSSRGSALTPTPGKLPEWKHAIIEHSCGSLLSTASRYRVACWQFPSFPH